MNNVVDFETGRSRPRRSVQGEADGAQILFFTGVRYERPADDDLPSFVPGSEQFCGNPAERASEASGIAFELAGC